MGMPRGGTHYFFPEEAVWLMETALGSVVHNGMALSVQQGYRLLESLGILWPKYAAYSYLKRSGYIVLPYNRPKNPDYSKPATSKPELKVASRFPADLMEQFPCLNADRQIRLAALHKRVSVASVFDISEHFPQPPTRPYKTDRRTLHKVASRFPADLMEQFPCLNADRQIRLAALHKRVSVASVFDISEHFPQPPTRPYKTDRRTLHKEYVRPRYWPRFDDFAQNSPSWAAYRQERAKLLSNASSTQSSLQKSSRTFALDYDVFASDGTYKHSLVPPPLFRLLVVKYVCFPYA
uniref:tRNA_int_end_N2 domain-containing protein n=1 Tax=Ascaris lumbricoides TaxID=6252 RepID=A0A0M3IE83_ASCLU